MAYDLNTLWFVLIAVLFIGFLFLEGFDYGVGILLLFVAKNDTERRQVFNSIGPHWDGNEVWLLTAGGAIFAAFPNWYATLFSGFYLALFVILLGLIARGVAFEFRSKDDNPTWRKTWDYALFIGSLLSGILWGVAIANIVHGVPIDENMTFTGNLFTLLNPYGLLGGLVTLSLFVLHGAIFLSLKTDDIVRERAENITKMAWLSTLVLVVLFVIYSFLDTDMFTGFNLIQGIGLVAAVVALLAAGYFVYQKTYAYSFIGTGITVVGVVMLLFGGLYPRVMPSSLGEQFDLTIYNASSSPYTLQVMTVVALIFVPIVLIYQAWTYYVFRERVTTEGHLEY